MTILDLPEKSTWSNWLSNEVFETKLVLPDDEQQIVSIVERARSSSEQVRVVGTGHSSSPLHRNNGTLISLDKLQGVVSGDVERQRAVVKPGTKIKQLGDPLWDLGLSLTNQGEIDRQAIAGAIGTGTHGTGLHLPSISSTLRRARIVTGTGEVVEVDASTPEELAAAQVAMGMLGVMTEIELAVSPAYEVHEWIGYVPFDDVFPHSLKLAETHRNFSILWLPTHQTAVNFDIVPSNISDASDYCFVKMYDLEDVDAGPIAAYGEVKRVDRSYRIYPDAWEPLFYEMEYMLPVDEGLACLPVLRQMIQQDFPESNMPVQMRFVAADDAFLSQNYGRPSVVLSVTTEPGKPMGDFFDRVHRLYTEYGGRPHWGKLHQTSVEALRSQFPQYDAFLDVRRRFDPDGVFLNEYLKPLFE